MWFAAKEAYERRLAERKRREGFSEGYRGGILESYREGFRQGIRQGREDVRRVFRNISREERERIRQTLAERGEELPTDIHSLIFDEPKYDADRRDL